MSELNRGILSSNGGCTMKVDYNRLFRKIKAENITQSVFKAGANISSATLVKMLHNESVTTETICRICDYFQCMPDEIMEWIPDSDTGYEQRKQEKSALEAQIAELQAKLKQM